MGQILWDFISQCEIWHVWYWETWNFCSNYPKIWTLEVVSAYTNASKRCRQNEKTVRSLIRLLLQEHSVWAMSWENLFKTYANSKGADQPVHLHSLISTFVVRCLSTSSFYIQTFKPLASFCGCTGRFVSYQVGNPEDRFSCDEAQSDQGPHCLLMLICPKT